MSDIFDTNKTFYPAKPADCAGVELLSFPKTDLTFFFWHQNYHFYRDGSPALWYFAEIPPGILRL
ncbi:hypothetical protein [Microcoleus sp. FACHB-68]|uniref:hypothetical protein n=1 Tax=Microcoleus sp. FACHB-68 TaxID=2692826 RepID=UPI001682602B|nr:hypothetical protein [Microcoleus sp. FACHB-68]MBD1936187.1 hypothetical protein [Microcoleus sp. FACHB-68]